MKAHWILPVFAAVTLAACSRTDQPAAGNGPALPDSPPVAEVDGEPVSQGMLDAYLRARGVSDPTAIQREAALEELVNLVLLRQQAEKSGLAQRPKVQFDLALQRLSTLATRQARTHLEQNPVTEEQAREEFERKRDVAGLHEYHLKHMLLPDRRTAEAVIKTLDEGGDFQQLAEDHSIDERNDKGGDLGWVNLAQLPPPLPEAAKQLDVGEHSKEPLQSRFGWHVLQVVDKRQLNPPAFDAVKSGLIANMQRSRMESYVEELRQGADIKMSKNILDAAAREKPEADDS